MKMEVCTTHPAISKFPEFRSCSNTKHLFLPTTTTPRTPFSIFLSRPGFGSGIGRPLFVKNEGDGDKQASSQSQTPLEDNPLSVLTMEDTPTLVHKETHQDQPFQQDSPLLLQEQVAHFVKSLNQKFESEDSYSLVLFGGTAATALYLASAIVGAIDSIPILPKLMEAVGLGYTVWFTSRYLLFKKNRDEVVIKVEELRQQVIGSKDK